MALDKFAIIIGVGGAGGYALEYIYKNLTYKDEVDFLAMNLQKSDLERLEIPSTSKVSLCKDSGILETNRTETAREFALKNADLIKAKLTSTQYKLAFIIAGMGGITGTGASPVIAEICKNTGIYTIAICSFPASFESRSYKTRATEGIQSLLKCVDNLAVFSINKIILWDTSVTLPKLFKIADKACCLPIEIILSTIRTQGIINLDFDDVKTALSGSKTTIFASGKGKGEKRVTKALENLKTSPFLFKHEITEAKNLLISIFCNNLMSNELAELEMFLEAFSKNIKLTWVYYDDSTLPADEVRVSMMMTEIKEFS